jgi:arylsulfatase A-like enzyme
MAREGCWIKTAWAATVCSPSRAMMMTGRYAHIHKWWHNKDQGKYIDQTGKRVTWPLYESSPLQLGHLAQQAGYGTYWAGKTQMAGDLTRFGFDEGCFTPGKLSDTDNPYTDFKHEYRTIRGVRTLVNVDTGEPVDTYWQHGWYWDPHVRLMNDPAAPDKLSWWPNSPESEKAFGPNTYGPDVELDFVFNFMERKQKEGKPFFVYHCSHLGHDAYDWFFPDSPSKWPGTPVIQWDGGKYIRTEPHVTGDKGVYDTHGTVTEPGIHNHVNYIDYQMWLYLQKLKEMGIENDTVMIICADNGTSGYGKGSPDRQKGTHVPFIIYAPGVETTKHGQQDILLDLSDVLPTVAEVMGAKLPAGYEINGQSFWPWLTGSQRQHRDWIYAYRSEMQLIRGNRVMKDGKEKWWDVSQEPDDLISYRQINDWGSVSELHREERERLLGILPQFDLHATEHDAPGVSPKPIPEKTSKAGF